MYIYDIFGPIIIQLVLRCTGAWLRRTGAWYFMKVYGALVFFYPPPCFLTSPVFFWPLMNEILNETLFLTPAAAAADSFQPVFVPLFVKWDIEPSCCSCCCCCSSSRGWKHTLPDGETQWPWRTEQRQNRAQKVPNVPSETLEKQ